MSTGQVYIADKVVLDGRLALYHKQERWLAVADLHFGYELSQRAAGNLFPFWGMQTVEARLLELLGAYRPNRLVLLGDLVHDASGAKDLFGLVRSLREHCEVILIAGNHDRALRKTAFRPEFARQDGFDLVDSWQTEGFFFHHGNCESDRIDGIQVIGHHHPAGAIRDGAGLNLKLPAFVQKGNCWIMPAFSPWAGGTIWPNDDEESAIWLCSPQRILQWSKQTRSDPPEAVSNTTAN